MFFKLIQCGLLFCLSAAAYAVDGLNLSLGDIQGTGWRAEQVRTTLHDFDGQRGKAEVHIGRLQITAFAKPLRNLRLTCANFTLTPRQVICPAGLLSSELRLFDHLQVRLVYGLQDKAVILVLERSRRDEHGRFTLRWENGGFSLDTHRLSLTAIREDLRYFVTVLPGWTFAGEADLQVRFDKEMAIHGQVRQLSYSNPDGTQAGENLALAMEISPRRHRSQTWDIQLNFTRGEIFSDPYYWAHPGQFLQLRTALAWDGSNLRLNNLVYNHPGTGEIHADLHMQWGKTPAIRHLRLNTSDLKLRGVYRNFLHDYLSGLEMQPVDVGGVVDVALDWGDGRGALDVVLKQLSYARMAEDKPDLMVSGINGELHWRSENGDAVPPSRLRWKGVRLSPKVMMDGGEIQARLYGKNLDLLHPFTLRLLDGGLRVEALQLRDILSANPQVEFSGLLQPISMPAISRAFGWPELGGQISGVLPSLRYADKQLQLGGALLLKVFDGDVVIHRLSLRIDKPPRLKADINLSKLDLYTLTRFFSFGEITGRLSGKINELHMINWQAVAFDAFFETPPDDDTPHRKISQKAINNLSSLGGAGVTQALSRSVLQFFNHFAYDRLGWGCRLDRGRCQMRGVARKEGGYYIVKGSTLPPRIDIIGYNRQVDWRDLLKRLKAVTRVGEAQFE